MRYILKKVGYGPVVCQSGPSGLSLEELKGLVGGYIEIVRIPGLEGRNMVAVCNEEGMYAGGDGGPLPANWCGLLGDFLVVTFDGANNQREMTDEEVLAAGVWLGAHWHQKHPIYGG